MWVKKQQLELDMEQGTGSKLGTEYGKAVYCHPAYLTYMQSAVPCLVARSCSTLCNPMDCSPAGSPVHGNSPGRGHLEKCWMSYKLESRLPGEIPTTSDMQMIPF